ncbi:MAG: CinA-like protein [Chloroflexus sp.]|uniref:competence/damage-inducible protein A n=1 Tax=Chloroflexus sp. TaxID=1904827 RepID=UPI0021DDAD59|nr:CinA family nicotinamide mononucleotide deamidase-related protein [Chloroflexus sp.]GIV88331.1 MAG: CinA-like protein [Chloroflexus sp.]
MDAEIIAIGSELLLGVTIDTNSAYIARQLATAGVNVYRKTVVGDNTERITAAIREALGRADLVICTGGLGPTLDDVTREAVAAAFDRPLEFHQALLDQIAARFAAMNRPMSESNRRQAYVPAGARIIPNPRGTAPAFLIEDERGTVIVLPGVPSEMRYLFETEVIPYLRNERGITTVILVRTLHAVGLGESVIGERIADLMQQANPTVGISAKRARYELRIGARAESHAEAEALIAQTEAIIRERLGPYLLGEEELPVVVAQLLRQRKLTLALYEGMIQAPILQALLAAPDIAAQLRGVEIHPLDRPADEQAASDLAAAGASAVADRWQSDLGLGVQPATFPNEQGFTAVAFALITPTGERRLTRLFDLRSSEGREFAGTAALDLLRRYLAEESE